MKLKYCYSFFETILQFLWNYFTVFLKLFYSFYETVKYCKIVTNCFFLWILKRTRDFWPVLCKTNKVSAKTILICIFYCGTVSRKTGEKITIFFQIFLASKMKLAVLSWVRSGIKLWNRQIRSGKKKIKLTARSAGKIETVGTRHFFSRSNMDGFIILATSTHESTASFIFEQKKLNKKP